MSTNHHIDAGWLTCIDFRLRKGRHKHIYTLGFHESDIAKLAGGALGIVSRNIDPNGECWRQLGLMLKLHHPRYIILEAHFGCGAVRELARKTFRSEADEKRYLAGMLRKAKRTVAKRLDVLKRKPSSSGSIFRKPRIICLLTRPPAKKGELAKFTKIS